MRKIISIILSFGLLFQQSGLVYAVGELNLANYLSQAHSAIAQPDQFRPPQLRYISYDIKSNDFKLLLDKGGAKLNELSNSLNFSTPKLNNATQELFNYFLIGLALPNDTFWVNLRPDAPENIIDPLLEKTDIGKIFLEADLQLKKDTASLTSPQNPEGKAYWDKLYKKAGELFGTENITIPTITRPWIVPNEVIVRETEDSAYIYKATLKVMLEADYLNGRGGSRTAPTPDQYAFSDPRLKELNEYSSQIIRETIIPKLTKEINSSKRYAQLRQVYYSLVLARWFKQKYSSLGSTRASEHQSAGSSANSYLSLIDSGNLANLASQQPCDKQSYFQAYQKSFKDGEYNLKETVATPFGQSIRSYVSGGIVAGSAITTVGFNTKNPAKQVTYTLTEQPPATTASPLTQQQAIDILNNLIPEKGDQLMLSEQTRQNMFETLINILSLTDKREGLYDNTYRVVINFMNGITNGKSVMKDIFASFGSKLQELKVSNEPFEKKNVDKLFSVIGKLLLDNLKKSLPREGLLINEKLIKLVQAKQAQPHFGLEQLEAVKYKDMLSAQLEALINELSEHLSRYEKDYKFADGIRDELLSNVGYIKGKINELSDAYNYYNELGKLLNDIIDTLSNYREKYAKEKEISVKIPYAVGDWWEKEKTDKHNDNRDNRIKLYDGLVDIFWNNEKSFEKTAGYIKMIINAKKLAKDSVGSPLTAEQEELINEIINVATSGREFESVPAEILYIIKSIIEEIADLKVEIKAEDMAKPIKDLIELDSLYWLEFIALLEKYSGVELLKNGEDIEIKLGEPVNKIVEDLQKRMSDENGGEFEGLLKLICRIEVDVSLKNVPWGVPMGKINEIRESVNKDKIGDAAFELGQIFLNQGDRKNVDACNLIRNAWRSVTSGSPVTPREILELAKKEINETNREFQYYRVNHYISYYERIDTADPFSKEDVIKKLTNEITALQDVIDKSKQNGSQISDVVSFEALRTKNFFKDLRKKLKNSPNQSAETRNNEVEKSGSPLTPDESVNYVDEALKKLTNFYQWDNEKSSDATLDDLIEAAKKAGESKLKPNAMEVTSEVEEWYGLAEKLAKIKSEWSVYAGSPLTIEQSKELFKEIVKTIQERGPTSRYKKISSMQGREYATFSGLKKLCEEFISYFEAEPGLYSLKKGELGRLKKFSLSLNVSIIAEKFPEKFYQSIATKMALLNSDYLTDIEYDPNGRPSHARFRGAIKIDIEDGQGNVRPFSCDIKVFPDNKIENKYEVMLIQGSDRVSIIVSEHGNKPAPINTNLFYNFHSDEELIPVAQSIVSFFNYPRAVASPLEILTEKFKAKGFSYGSLNAYVKLKEYLKELDAGQPIELDGIVYDSKSIEIINTIDNANNRYAQISVFSEDKSVPYHRIIIRGYQKSGSVFTYLDMGQDYERQDNEKKLPKDREDLKERLEGTAFNDYDNFADVIMTAINKAVSKPTKKASGSLPAKGVSSSLQLKRGGIDLTDRMLKINLERVGSFASSALILPEITNLEALDLDKEFEQIQAMVSSSIRPSDTRILEFAAACYYREEFDQRLAQVSSCIKAAHLADEISGRDSSDALRLATMLPDALYGG